MKKILISLSSLVVLLSLIAGATTGYSVGENSPIDYKNKSAAWWQKVLKSDVYNICRAKGTEPAFSGVNDKEAREGVYYCACCGGDYPLFSSKTKFDSGTGWPSFWAPIDPNHIILAQHFWGLFSAPEVKCARCESHLGHVFDDGPPPTGKRYCMNSLALTFVAIGQPVVRTFHISTGQEKPE